VDYYCKNLTIVPSTTQPPKFLFYFPGYTPKLSTTTTPTPARTRLTSPPTPSHQNYQTHYTHSISTIHTSHTVSTRHTTLPTSQADHKVPSLKDTVSTESTTPTSLAFVVFFLSSTIPHFLLVHALGRGLNVFRANDKFGRERYAGARHARYVYLSACSNRVLGASRGLLEWGM